MITLALAFCQDEEAPLDPTDPGDPCEEMDIPVRPGPRIQTTPDVPHIQIGVEAVPHVHEELFRRVFSLPGVENQLSVVPPWRALHLNESIHISRPDALIGDREFAHIHTDGSLHIYLPYERAKLAVESKWAIWHPFAGDMNYGAVNFVMLYTPQSIDELNETFQLIVDAYNNVAGTCIDASDYY